MKTCVIISARTRTIFWLIPTLFKAHLRCTKSSNFDALRLSESAIFFYLVETLANGRVVRVVDVDVGARTWPSYLEFFV